MNRVAHFHLFVIALAALVLCIARPGFAQEPPQPAAYSQDELDQLLAPVALYPDDLLMQILVASTYPLEVIEAARFVQANPNLNGPALDDAVAQRNWDPSVQSLTAFPQVLAMMNDKLEWMERLGDAFLADQQRVMDTVQSLRRRAETSGNLASTTQQQVVNRDNVIIIAPAVPDVVYVPVYDPLTVYGPWWAPGYPPWFWYPPTIYGYPVIFTGIAFGIGWTIGSNHWGWCHPDWHGHHVVLDTDHNRFWDRPNRPRPPPGQAWQHSPYHRRGVPYADAQTQQRFQPTSPDAIRERQNYRGYAPAPRAPASTPRQTPTAQLPQAPAARPGQPPAAQAQAPVRQGQPPAMQPQAPAARAGEPPAVQAQPPAVRQAQPPALQAQPPVARQTPPPVVTAPQAPMVRPAQPPVTQPQAPVVRQAPAAPAFGTQRTSPSAFDPGLSRSQAQINAQRGVQSLHSSPAPVVRAPVPSSAPAMRAPSAAPVMRAPSAAPAMRAPSAAPAMRAPAAPSHPTPAPRGH